MTSCISVLTFGIGTNMHKSEMLNRSLVAASVAGAEGFEETKRAFENIARTFFEVDTEVACAIEPTILVTNRISDRVIFSSE